VQCLRPRAGRGFQYAQEQKTQPVKEESLASIRRTDVPQLPQISPQANCQERLTYISGDRMPTAKKKRTGKRPSVVICVCGMAGSGKSTLAKRIAEKYRLRYYSGGDALMALALEQGYSARDRGWWESKEGLRFLEQRGKDPRFDKAIDRKQQEMAEEGNVVFDSWTMPWLLPKGFKVWLEASTEKRAERIAKRDQTDFDEALRALKQKEAQTRAIYAKMYRFSLGEDYSPFNFILDTETLSAEEVFQVLCMVIERIVLK